MELNQRLTARLRTCVPLAFLLPGFMGGQIAEHFAHGKPLLAGVAAAVSCFVFWKKRCPWWMTALLCGFIPGAAAMYFRVKPVSLCPSFSATDSLYVKVAEPPRFRQPGLKEMALEVYGYMERKSQGEPRTFRGFKERPKIMSRAVDLPWKNISRVKEGSLFWVRGEFRGLRQNLNPFSYDNALIRHGYCGKMKVRFATRPQGGTEPWISRLRKSLRSLVEEVLGQHETAGLVLSMSVGTRDVLSPQTERAFKRTGLAHLLVVSGYQVTLIYYLTCLLLRFFAAKSVRLCLLTNVDLVSSLAALFFACFFIFVAGVEGASARAGLAVVFVCVSRFLERGGGMGGAIAVSFILLSTIWPGAWLEAGVQLTYAALLGIMIGAGRGEKGLKALLKVCLYASVCTSIVSLFWFRTFSAIGFVLNPVFAPLLSYIGCTGSFMATGLYWTGLDRFGLLLKLVGRLLEFARDFIWWASKSRLSFEELDLKTVIPLVVFLAFIAGRGIKKRLDEFVTEWNLQRVFSGIAEKEKTQADI